MQHQIRSLSGGQQGKLLLLDLVLRKPNFLLLDEPTRNFSPTSQPQIRNSLQPIQAVSLLFRMTVVS